MRGILIGEDALLVTDAPGAKPVRDVEAPEAPEGYEAKGSWVDTGEELVRSWRLEPKGGTAAEAAVELARIQARSLSDADAVRVAPLYDDWSGDGVKYYGPDDHDGIPQSRVRYQGYLVKCISTHTSQPDWAPNAAPSLWALILPGQDGSGVEVGVWVQPGADNAYQPGDRVIHDGHLWESTFTDDSGSKNVWEPGATGVGEDIWADLGEWDGGEA